MEKDTLVLGGQEFTSRFILGSGKYSLDLIKASVENAGAQIITLALRRANVGGTANILDYIPEGVTLLPNTSGARNADEAVRIARLSREVGCGNFVKIEIMRDSKYLLYHERAGNNVCKHRSKISDDRDQRILQCMSKDNLYRRNALCPCSTYIILSQNIEHRRSRKSCNIRHGVQRQRNDRKYKSLSSRAVGRKQGYFQRKRHK